MDTSASNSPVTGAAPRVDRSRLLTMAVATSMLTLCGVTGVLMFLHRRGHLIDELHTWSGLALIVAMVLHLVRYRRALGNHLRHAVVWCPLVVALFLSGVALAFANAGEAHQPGTGRHRENVHSDPSGREQREDSRPAERRRSSER